jgi:hypothetical protein
VGANAHVMAEIEQLSSCIFAATFVLRARLLYGTPKPSAQHCTRSNQREGFKPMLAYGRDGV